MSWKDYCALTMRTAIVKDDAFNAHHMALGLWGEYGEILDAVKRADIYGRDLDRVNLGEEFGDLCWYLGAACQMSGIAADVAEPTLAQPESGPMLGYRLLGLSRHIQQFVSALRIWALRSEMNAIDREVARARLLAGANQLREAVANVVVVDYGLDMQAILDGNLRKLQVRYPEKFVDVVVRDSEAEREALR